MGARGEVATGRRRRGLGPCIVPSALAPRQNKSRSRPTRSGRTAYQECDVRGRRAWSCLMSRRKCRMHRRSTVQLERGCVGNARKNTR
eukprot:100583-Pyramimonas_sp.AAC.1